MSIADAAREARVTPGLAHQPTGEAASARSRVRKQPHLYAAIFAAWSLSLLWFGPRMWSLIDLAGSGWELASIAYFVVFAQLAWLYGYYNVGVVAFAALRGRAYSSESVAKELTSAPAVAVLYTTCNDFVEHSALSCVELDYPDFHVYLLDDSTEPKFRARVDAFAARNLGRVTVVRRPDRRGFKAGNLNNALQGVATEPFFAVVDADEVLPRDFLRRLTPRLMADPSCGFIQANHRSRPDAETRLAQDMGVGIDIHWKWYQPLRNDFGFVMFLGHGALLRRRCWEEAGGFPEIVSEDLAYAIAIREKGYHGVFASDVTCLEEFPATVEAFRARHVKWTRGTCEFLHHWLVRLVRARRITAVEKLDILFPTLNLPLTFFFFIFMANAALVLPQALGRLQELTFVFAGAEFAVPVLTFRPGVERIFGFDFFAITMMTIVAPILCFIVELSRRPLRLLRFLAHSTALYAALSPLSFVAVVGYALTRKAQFLVTGAASGRGEAGRGLRRFLERTHPDATAVQAIEFGLGAGFLVAALMTFQVSFVGVALGFMMLPLMHDLGWRHPALRWALWAPFVMIVAGVLLGAAGVLGLQPVFFGFGFHF